MTTEENAWAAFAGESQANRKYANFAQQADSEGFPLVARIFRAASEAEAIHARRLLIALKAIGTTEENLSAAVSGETEEYEAMYPGFIKEAEEEGVTAPIDIFTHAMKAEKVHAGIYAAALAAVKEGKDLDGKEVYVCPYCGNVVLDEPPEHCPICGVPGPKFILIK
ncbi:rubrerythrin [Methanomicrobiaceae archaeon CYW5]|uniref:rubrerythrin family protein n=1 Tax=Methanovulcanius yangii TaxID=1789227 RepID=UPI0029CA5FBA|nr:rubrerythrin family protein [Methanovulcanius yangii]MBT8508378.1 rubrerythrin [Methanovulcanius yangii]